MNWLEVNSALRCCDDPANIRTLLRELADSRRVDVILTTGGTGLGPRDNTLEATNGVAERIVPGLAEELRRKGAEKTPTAVLSRGVAVIRHHSVILNLPGSPKGAVESRRSGGDPSACGAGAQWREARSTAAARHS